MPVLKTLRTLFAYALCFLLVVNIPHPLDEYLTVGGIFLLVCFIAAVAGSNYAFNVWYQMDVIVCTICHGTRYRTISGWTGQYMDKHLRYKYQAWVIDYLAMLFGDKPNHCKRMYLWEKQKKITS